MPSHHPDIELVAGDDWSIVGTVLDDSGNPLDLTGSTLVWTFIDPDGETMVDLITASSISPNSPPTAGILTIAVPRGVTAPLLAGRYHDALRVIPTIGASTYWLGSILIEPDPMSLPLEDFS